MPTISEREMARLKNKSGVYSSLRKPIQHKLAEKMFESEPFIVDLRRRLYRTIKLAFNEYAKRHGCKPENLQLEWDRFNKILEKYL